MKMSERELVRSQKEQKKKQNIKIALGILALLIVIVAVVLVLRLTRTKMTLANEQGMSVGDPNAPVKVVEFSNYSCSHCKTFTLEHEPDFIKDYVDTGKVYYTAYPYPWNEQDPTYKASLASYCAAEQNIYFAFKDEVFRSVAGVNDLADGKILEYAKRVGADMGTFEKCFVNPETVQRIAVTKGLADGNNVTGTPSFIVNSKLVYMNQLVPAVKEALGESN